MCTLSMYARPRTRTSVCESTTPPTRAPILLPVSTQSLSPSIVAHSDKHTLSRPICAQLCSIASSHSGNATDTITTILPAPRGVYAEHSILPLALQSYTNLCPLSFDNMATRGTPSLDSWPVRADTRSQPAFSSCSLLWSSNKPSRNMPPRPAPPLAVACASAPAHQSY